MQIIAENDRGWVALDGNELIVGSKVDDPAKLRGTSPITEHGGGGFAISFNMHRDFGRAVDGHGQIEMGMIRCEQDEGVRGQIGNPKGEMNFMLNDGGGGEDGNMRKPLAFVWNAITRSLLSLFGGATSDTMWAPNGLSFTQQQDDGNFVTYRTIVPFSKAPEHVTYIWQSGTAQ